ncbi:EF-hand [Neocallimastix californiae]|uniref:EF-hand n=1 Tax=Neocallimastix californiae TaxID=1754190 RepID=A0A1Y2AJH5_9FUNG|nr:EF-hand [Neocallimastix californiae]|eukprot:ORY22729.1 EF-hand [Neocallimastix californiae]
MSSHISNSNSYLSKDSNKKMDKKDVNEKTNSSTTNSGLNRNKTSSKDFLATKENIKNSLLNSDNNNNDNKNNRKGKLVANDKPVVNKSKVKFNNPETEILLNLLWEVSEEQAKTDSYIHRNVTCNNCGIAPIRGIRYKCANCVDYDLCSACEAQDVHIKTHLFLKIRIPFPPLSSPRSALLNTFYPGKEFQSSTTLTWDKLRNLQKKTKFDHVELEAFYDLFQSLSTVEGDDENEGGITKEVFEQCLGPLSIEKNLVTERIFSFFDQDDDGVINFGELVCGLSVLLKGTLDEKVKYAFMGYDLDGDGYITPTELYNIFKAYFYLSMELVRDIVNTLEGEDEDNILDPTLNKSQTKDSEDSGLAQSTQKPRRTNLLEEQRKQLIIQIEQKNKKSIGNYDDNLTPMTANSAFSIYNSHSPLKQRMSISASSNAGNNSFVNNGNEEAETLEEEEIWPIMEVMSQEAIEEMVEKTFLMAGEHAIQSGRISFEEFKKFVKTDPTIISWFHALGTVF